MINSSGFYSQFSFLQRLLCTAIVATNMLYLPQARAQSLTSALNPAQLANKALGDARGWSVVGVLLNGEAKYASAQNNVSTASTNMAASQEPTQQLFEIGSISKVFTGLLLAQAVERGELKLENSLGVLLQGKASFASPHVASVTLRQLITHSSCLPRMPPDFVEDYDTNNNPYAKYDRRRLWTALSALELKNPAPCAASYSNFGIAVVGEILSERYGKPWHVLVHENITMPLGMMDTVQLLGDKSARMAPAYNNATPTSPWDFQALAGAGALRSTAADMLKFSHAVMAGRAGPLGPAVERLLTPLGMFQNGQIGYAVMMRGPVERRTYFHNGLTGGFSALWMIAPDMQEALVALTSNAHAVPGTLFTRSTAIRYPVTAVAITLKPEQLTEYAGIFRINETSAFTFVVQDGVLYRRITGNGFRPLVPAGSDTFIEVEMGVQYVFRREGGVLVGVAFTQGGGASSGMRTTESAPLVAVIPLVQQDAYVGRFQLKRLTRRDLNFDVKSEGGQLTVRSSNWQRLPVFPMAGRPDRFIYESGKTELQFERDVDGKVVALVLHEGGVMRMPRVLD